MHKTLTAALGANAMASGGQCIQINGTILDPDAGTLSRDGVILPLRRKAFMLLSYLAGRQGQVVSKDELMDALWPNVMVTEDSLTQAVRDVRGVLRDEAGEAVRTVRGRGYLLAGTATAPAAASGAQAHVRRVAILPFAPGLLDGAKPALLDMLAHEVAAGLARFVTIRVLSGLSLARPGAAPAAAPVPAEADYVIDGSAIPFGDGLRLRVRLVDVATGALVASNTFDCAGAQFLDAQSVAVQRIIGYLQLAIETQPLPQSNAQGPGSVAASVHLARGLWASHGDSPHASVEARAHFRRAVAADPDFALAWSNLAFAEIAVHDYGAAPQEVLDTALAHAVRGVDLAPQDARTHSALGYVQCMRGEFVAAEVNVRRAHALNPANTDGICDMIAVLLGRGRPAEAIEWLLRMTEIQPIGSTHEHTQRGEALYMLRRYDEAADEFLRVGTLSNRRRAFLAAMLAQAGRDDEAVAQLRLVSQDDPEFDHIEVLVKGYRYENPSDRDHLVAGMRKALSLR